MAQLNSNLNDQSWVFNGLGTFTQTVTAAGDYIVQGQLTLPRPQDNSGNGSSVTAVVIHNSSSVAPVGAAGATGYRVKVPSVAVGDTLGVTLASSAAIDQSLNAIKHQMQIFMGDC